MRTFFTFSIWLLATTCAFGQVPEPEQAFIVTEVTITDPAGNAPEPSSTNVAIRTAEIGLNNRRNTRYLSADGYQVGEATSFTTETWYQAGNTNVSVRYGSWRYTNIRHKERQHTISYAELEDGITRTSLSRSNELQPGTPVRRLVNGPANQQPGTVVRRPVSGPANLSPGDVISRSTDGLVNLPSGNVAGSSGRGPKFIGGGMIITDAEQASAKAASPLAMPLLDTTGVAVKVLLQDEEREVAGYPCKRAIISLMRNDSVLVQIKAWYNTQVYLPYLPATGNPYDASVNLLNVQMEHFYALAQLPGLAMQYEMPDLFGNTITVEVTKLKTNKKPRSKQFTAPGSIKIVPYAERNT